MTQNISTGPLLLIVDDALDLLEMWQLLLESSGFRVVTAVSGLSGLEQAKRCRPDLIVTDYTMPGMDGLTLCRNLKADPMLKQIPVILWTASLVTIDDPVVDRFLMKPVFLELLLDEIRALLPDTSFGAPAV